MARTSIDELKAELERERGVLADKRASAAELAADIRVSEGVCETLQRVLGRVERPQRAFPFSEAASDVAGTPEAGEGVLDGIFDNIIVGSGPHGIAMRDILKYIETLKANGNYPGVVTERAVSNRLRRSKDHMGWEMIGGGRYSKWRKAARP